MIPQCSRALALPLATLSHCSTLLGALFLCATAGAQCVEAVPIVNADPLGSFDFVELAASDGDTIATRARRGFSVSNSASKVTLFERAANGQYSAALEASVTGEEVEDFGRAVSISGDWMALGVRDTDALVGFDPTNTARVEMFRRGPAGWVPHSVIPAPFPQLRDLFADSVVLDGDDLIVTAPIRALPSAGQEGAVYAYRLVNGVWEFRQELLPPAQLPATGSLRFGTAVFVEDDTLVVEARFAHAFIYSRPDPTGDWLLSSRIDDRALYRFADGRLASKGLPNDPKLRVYERDAAGEWGLPSGFEPVEAPGFQDELEWDGTLLVLSRSSSSPVPFTVYEWDGAGLQLVRDIERNWFGTEAMGTNLRLYESRLAISATVQSPLPWGAQLLHLVDPRCHFGGRVDCDSSAPNSLGLPSALVFVGSTVLGQGDRTLHLAGLPPGTFGMLLVSRTAGRTESPGNSHGTLCLGGLIGRFVRPGEVFMSSPSGSAQRSIDLEDLPLTPGGAVDPAGETLYFQAWYRDWIGGAPSSLFTSSLAVEFTP